MSDAVESERRLRRNGILMPEDGHTDVSRSLLVEQREHRLEGQNSNS